MSPMTMLPINGVDVYGRDVAPADLNGGHDILKSLPKEIEFPVTVDFFDYVGLAVPDGISGSKYRQDHLSQRAGLFQ